MGFGMTPLISRRGGTAYLLVFHLHTATALPLLGSSTSEGAFDASGGLAGGHTQLNAGVELRDLERVYYCDATTEGSDMERVCFNSCNNINAKIAPQWFQFDEFCQRQAESNFQWLHPLNEDCRIFYECLYGCEMNGGDRIRLQRAAPDYRVRLVNDVQMGITEVLKKCDAMKCKAYCAKDSFTTCREMQFRTYCHGEKAALDSGQGCDVECNSSWRSTPLQIMNLSIVLTATWLLL